MDQEELEHQHLREELSPSKNVLGYSLYVRDYLSHAGKYTNLFTHKENKVYSSLVGVLVSKRLLHMALVVQRSKILLIHTPFG